MSLSQKGHLLRYDEDGYEYRKDRMIKNGTAISYRCTKTGCRGRMHEDVAKGLLTVTNDHEERCLPMKQKREIKQNAKLDRLAGVPTKDIIRNRVLDTPEHLMPLIKQRGIRQMVRRQKQVAGSKEWLAPITGTFRVLFLRYDNCASYTTPNEEALKFFATDWGIGMLLKHHIWSVDGTFHVAPFGFTQVLVIGVEWEHLFVPCAYAFLMSKEAKVYAAVFRLIMQLGVPLPTNIKIDMELGILNGFVAVYGNWATIHFCCFHFFKAIYRKIKEKKLDDVYCDRSNFVYAKGLLALTFINPMDVRRYFLALRDEAALQMPTKLNELCDLYAYFENSFIGKAQNNRFFYPTHAIETWNSYDSISRGEQLGNSSQESYNSLLKSIASRYSALYVAQKLLDLEEDYEKRVIAASSRQLTLPQASAQSPKVFYGQRQRKIEVQNDPLGIPGSEKEERRKRNVFRAVFSMFATMKDDHKSSKNG